ncbi:hypothetical protein ACTHGU_20420 [Chitinophagaceae bacterium MMS25-I14]
MSAATDGTVNKDGIDFPYTLREGVSGMRLGKYILQQEGIPEMLGYRGK